MRASSTMLTFVLAVVMWTTVVWVMRQRRVRMVADPSPRELRSYRLHNVAVISAAVGVTWFFALALDGHPRTSLAARGVMARRRDLHRGWCCRSGIRRVAWGPVAAQESRLTPPGRLIAARGP